MTRRASVELSIRSVMLIVFALVVAGMLIGLIVALFSRLPTFGP